eukprot:gene12530-15746_t
MIKQQYLGGEKQKKKTMKPSDKFRFNFDWEVTEDTSKDLNPLYNNTHEAALLYGRGMRAGIDRREQKKSMVTLEQQILRKNRQAAGIEETTETRKQEREREKQANMYDGFDMRVEKHWTDKPKEEMTDRDWRIFREDFNISYKGNAGVLPMRGPIDHMGYKKPSPIQMAAIPLGLKGRDVIGVAETGSGKTSITTTNDNPHYCYTLAYILRPITMTEERYAEGPYTITTTNDTPTTLHTADILRPITYDEERDCEGPYSFKTLAIVGGQSIEEQGAKLRRGCEIVVATPGRLIDCIDRSYAVLNQCNYVVLDEADRMIDLGFEPQPSLTKTTIPSWKDRSVPSCLLGPKGQQGWGAQCAQSAQRMLLMLSGALVELLSMSQETQEWDDLLREFVVDSLLTPPSSAQQQPQQQHQQQMHGRLCLQQFYMHFVVDSLLTPPSSAQQQPQQQQQQQMYGGAPPVIPTPVPALAVDRQQLIHTLLGVHVRHYVSKATNKSEHGHRIAMNALAFVETMLLYPAFMQLPKALNRFLPPLLATTLSAMVPDRHVQPCMRVQVKIFQLWSIIAGLCGDQLPAVPDTLQAPKSGGSCAAVAEAASLAISDDKECWELRDMVEATPWGVMGKAPQSLS